jgi:diguanylate cyclase (GGDEF)-like protein
MTHEPTVIATGIEPARAPSIDRLRELVDAAGIATVFTTIRGDVLEVNAAGGELFRTHAVPGGRLDGRESLRTVLEQIPQRLLNDPEGGVWHGDVDLAVPGAPASIQAATVLVRHDPQTPDGGFIAVMCRDVTDDRSETAELRHLLEHDSMTGLLNRGAALDRVAAAVRDLDVDGGEVAILIIDVDRLRDVNDALGHDIGDRLLASTAKRLTTAVRPSDVVARVGGDQFLVLCHAVPDSADAMDMADRLRRALTGRLTIRQLELNVSVSVGVSITEPAMRSQDPVDVAGQLASRADAAVHAAKQAGRACSVIFTEQLQNQAKVRTELAAALSKALRDGELYVEYQPIFSAVSEHAEAAEALIRWSHPVRGRIEASEFIPVAEDTGVIVPIGDWVIQQACIATRHWIDHGMVGPRFAVHVNVSRLQLSSSSFVNRVVDLLREYRLRPRQIVFEAREATLLGNDTEAVIRSVRALRRVGVRIALDNFGTGSHALSLLTEIGADVLKLDGGLALPTGSSEADTRVVRALVLLAHALNMEVVAERVTGLEQLRRLRAAGCDLVQGHLVGKPSAPEHLVTHMNLD